MSFFSNKEKDKTNREFDLFEKEVRMGNFSGNNADSGFGLFPSKGREDEKNRESDTMFSKDQYSGRNQLGGDDRLEKDYSDINKSQNNQFDRDPFSSDLFASDSLKEKGRQKDFFDDIIPGDYRSGYGSVPLKDISKDLEKNHEKNRSSSPHSFGDFGQKFDQKPEPKMFEEKTSQTSDFKVDVSNLPYLTGQPQQISHSYNHSFHSKNDELKGLRFWQSPQEEDDYQEEPEEQEERSVSLRMIIAIGALLGMIGLAYFGYVWFNRQGEGEPILIKAEEGDYKVRPENPGGISIPNQDKYIYSRITPDAQNAEAAAANNSAGNNNAGEGTEQQPLERLLPPEEKPEDAVYDQNGYEQNTYNQNSGENGLTGGQDQLQGQGDQYQGQQQYQGPLQAEQQQAQQYQNPNESSNSGPANAGQPNTLPAAPMAGGAPTPFTNQAAPNQAALGGGQGNASYPAARQNRQIPEEGVVLQEVPGQAQNQSSGQAEYDANEPLGDSTGGRRVVTNPYSIEDSVDNALLGDDTTQNPNQNQAPGQIQMQGQMQGQTSGQGQTAPQQFRQASSQTGFQEGESGPSSVQSYGQGTPHNIQAQNQYTNGGHQGGGYQAGGYQDPNYSPNGAQQVNQQATPQVNASSNNPAYTGGQQVGTPAQQNIQPVSQTATPYNAPQTVNGNTTQQNTNIIQPKRNAISKVNAKSSTNQRGKGAPIIHARDMAKTAPKIIQVSKTINPPYKRQTAPRPGGQAGAIKRTAR